MNQEILRELIPVSDEEERFLNGDSEINRTLYMEDESNIINSKKLLSEGKLITVRLHTRFVHFPEHTHDYIEVIYMCNGSTTHIINGETVVLKEGDLLFLPQSSRQEILPAGGNDIAVNFIILPQFFDQSMQMLGNEESPLKSFIIDCLKNKTASTPYLHFEVADVLPVQNLLENLIWTLLNGSQNKRKINETTMGLLFLQLLNCTDKLSYSTKEDELILGTLRYVEEHYKSGSLSDLAEKMHYDFAWLSREIKRRTGKTYTELVQEKRLSQSAYLLKNTTMRVDDIAADVGYENISYFHRIFEKKFSLSPKKFRDGK